MNKTEWRIIFSVILIGLLFFIASLLFTSIGRETWFLGITSIYAPLTALTFGVSGLRIYGKDSGNTDDRFNAMNLWLAVGLILLGFAEVAGTIVMLSLNPPQMTLIVALVQLPGLLLWGIGIIHYLRSLNSSLHFVEENKLWGGLFFITTLSVLCLIVVTAIQFPMIDLIETVVLSPIIIGLVLFTVITIGLVWIFRKGALVKPLFFIVGALMLYLMRSLLWLFVDANLGSPTDSVIAIVSFTLCGGALLLARELGRIDTD